MSDWYAVIGINGQKILVDAEDFEADCESIIFMREGKNVAWFDSKNIIGFVKEDLEHETTARPKHMGESV